MSIETYTELKSAIAEIIEDDSVEVSAFIPKAIYIAEERLSRDLDLKTLHDTTIVSVVTNTSIPGGGIETKVSTNITPTHFIEFNHIFQNGNKLDNVDYSFVKEVNQWESSLGTSARYYAFKQYPNVIYCAPPVSSGTFEINFKKRPTKLSNNNTSNDLLARMPDLLLYRSLIEMSLFLKNWETVQFWQTLYDSALETALNVGRKERMDIGQKHEATGVNMQSTTGIV